MDDQRNHPATVFFSRDMPIVISSDDPSFWEATPLSHDFYAAFLGITTSTSDLRTLKKLAKNSIKYSSLNADEKEIAYEKWQEKWDEFIQSLIQDGNSASQPAWLATTLVALTLLISSLSVMSVLRNWEKHFDGIRKMMKFGGGGGI